MRRLTKALTGLAVLALTAGPAVAQTPAPAKPPTTAPAATPAVAKPTPTRTAAAVQPVPAGLTCADAIVWVNTSSHKFRTPGQRLYGATKRGKYVCQKDAVAEGDKPVK